MAQFVYTMHQVGKVVPPKKEILKDISLSFFPGAKIGVLGLNGSGKSTLLRIMAGVDKEFNGEARAQSDINIGYLPQEPELDESLDVKGNVQQGIQHIISLVDEFNAISDRFAEPMSDEEMTELLEKQGDLQTKIDAVEGWEVERILERAADALRLPPWDAEVAKLSGGEKRRVALCRLLLSKPDMLLLDEPTNHLDAESVAWMERFLQDYPGTVVAITHDRYFLDNAAGWILELDRGHGIPYEGNYSTWLETKEARLEVEAKQQSAHEKTIRSELEWVRANPKGRQSKSKARIARFEELNSQDFQKRNETQELYIPPGQRLGDKVLEVNHLCKGFGDKNLIDDLSFSVPKGSIVGIIGGNGAGKTTFLRMLVGDEKPDSGSIELGETVNLAYVDQSRDELNGENTVWQEISDGQDVIQIGRTEVQSRAYASRFNFKGGDQQKFVKDLSGGERNRLHMAKLLKRGGNVLLLDEPTNDLDVETLRALEEGLLTFPGCAIVVSHDRWFLDRICTHILAFEGDSQVVWHEGNYTDYEAERKKRLGDGAEPTRIKYKKLNS
ncbi:MAG: energy-dependent translational throttle protein EttA [Gammaproteobacteria bacterium]|jgi:ATP-binding cassette ChvD family protein|nr:energy-dependent translational throttle protein EttA [Gammaproteobacteria bacterium]MBT3859304.1 energy-dependent translational throttle protein EttA [Gammaproteobacteria bacterium]MBT3987994.1 energy-dependent translational throttle protein EttA [Gammaproteobacteria bacterium]MBT4255394.1 energy-dependent translational throttle protein EttA [Gammaproteobacteria bacterium]MBT4658048.1 energy-dependent translational throttle protein EttA [Gammaproteobacteria bacterium]